MTDEDAHKLVSSWLWGSGLFGGYLDLMQWPILPAGEVYDLRAKYDPLLYNEERRKLDARPEE